jgi:hypothetical protein
MAPGARVVKPRLTTGELDRTLQEQFSQRRLFLAAGLNSQGGAAESILWRYHFHSPDRAWWTAAVCLQDSRDSAGGPVWVADLFLA